MKIIDFGLSDFIWPGNVCLFINLHLYLVYEQWTDIKNIILGKPVKLA